MCRRATTRSRPIINTRDEPHADAGSFRRLHVIVGDSNMSETTTLLKLASTDLVLRMIEANVPMRDFTLENPIRAIREISHDMTGRRKVRLANGREASALEIQREYLERVQSFVDRTGTDATGKRVLELWQRTLEAVESGNLDLVAREIDWVAKYKLLERYRAKHGLSLVPPGGPARLDLPRHSPGPRPVLPAPAARADGAGGQRPADFRSEVGAAADDAGPAARRVH